MYVCKMASLGEMEKGIRLKLDQPLAAITHVIVADIFYVKNATHSVRPNQGTPLPFHQPLIEMQKGIRLKETQSHHCEP